MNKYVEGFNAKYNLAAYSAVHFSGKIDDYQFGYLMNPRSTPTAVATIFTYINDDIKNDLLTFLQGINGELKLQICEIHNFGIVFGYKNVMTVKSGVLKIENATLKIIEKLNELEALKSNYCPICGKEMTNPVNIFINGFAVMIDDDCKAMIDEQKRKENEAFKAKPNNYFKGTLGAALFGLAGLILWVVLVFLTNSIFALCAIAIAFLASLGYDKLGGKNNYMKILVPSIITILYSVAATFISYLILCIDPSGKESAFEILMTVLEIDSEIRAEFISNLVTSLLFGVIGIFASWKFMAKALHR